MALIPTPAFVESPYNHPVGSGPRVYRHALGASDEPSAADRLQFFRLAKGQKLADAYMFCTDMDSVADGLVTLVLTDGTTTHALTASSSIQAAGFYRATLAPGIGLKLDSEDWYLAIVWDVVAATFVAGSIGVGFTATNMLEGE